MRCVVFGGVWRHIAVTWDGTTKRGFFNGVKMLELEPPAVLFAGRLGFMTGAVDDIRVWSRVLSDAEIQNLAQ